VSTQPTEPSVVAEVPIKEVQVDLKMVLLYLVFRGGSHGLMEDGITDRFVYYDGTGHSRMITPSSTEVKATIEALEKDGVIVRVQRQIDSGGTMGTFFTFAENVQLVAKPVE